jgi:catechol 2,3-dioxygenase-like lactoylglutathione lyase family enzyme
MIGYALVGTNDMPKALAFYDGLFETIGVKRLWDMGDRGASWGPSWDKPSFGVCKPYDGNAATVGNGTMIALVMDSRAKVDAVHARALALGGTDEGAPGLRGEEGPQAFYGAYFRDLDGNKLCAFRMGPAE